MLKTVCTVDQSDQQKLTLSVHFHMAKMLVEKLNRSHSKYLNCGLPTFLFTLMFVFSS